MRAAACIACSRPASSSGGSHCRPRGVSRKARDDASTRPCRTRTSRRVTGRRPGSSRRLPRPVPRPPVGRVGLDVGASPHAAGGKGLDGLGKLPRSMYATTRRLSQPRTSAASATPASAGRVSTRMVTGWRLLSAGRVRSRARRSPAMQRSLVVPEAVTSGSPFTAAVQRPFSCCVICAWNSNGSSAGRSADHTAESAPGVAAPHHPASYDRHARDPWGETVTEERVLGGRECSSRRSTCMWHWISSCCC